MAIKGGHKKYGLCRGKGYENILPYRGGGGQTMLHFKYFNSLTDNYDHPL